MRGDDGYGATDYWTNGIDISNVSNVQADGLSIYGSSSQQGTGINLVGLPGSSTYGVQYNVVKSTIQYLATGILYGSYVQGSVDQSNFTFTTNGIGSAGSETGALVQLSVTNSQFNPDGVSNGNGIVASTAIGSATLANNLFVIGGTNQAGIQLAQAKHFTITGNEIQGIGSTTSSGIVIGTTQSSSPGVVSGNDIYGFSGTGIWLQTNSTLVNVVNNVFASNGTNILNSGSNDVVTGNLGYNPVGASSLSPGASPWSYSASSSPETLYMDASTSISSITQGGTNILPTTTANAIVTVELGRNETAVITCSGTLAAHKMVPK